MSRRTEKVEELIRQEFSKLMQRDLGEIYGLISVNRVFMTSDLKTAHIYISAIPSEGQDKLLKQLNQNTNYYKKQIGNKLTLRYTPQILFKLDESRAEVDKVEQLLEKIDRGT